MKKIAFCIMAAGLSLTFHPLQSNAAALASYSYAAGSKAAEVAKAKALLLRLNEINMMDKSNLNHSDKKKLRMEVLSIRNQLGTIGGGVYLSAGAIIIILLLLILFL